MVARLWAALHRFGQINNFKVEPRDCGCDEQMTDAGTVEITVQLRFRSKSTAAEIPPAAG
jgi:hypothetical protein